MFCLSRRLYVTVDKWEASHCWTCPLFTSVVYIHVVVLMKGNATALKSKRNLPM